MKVNSSTISEIDYDSVSKTLTIHFIKGGIYSYKEVGEDAYTDLMKSESVGKHFHKYIRSVYKFEKLDKQLVDTTEGESDGTSK